MAYNLGNTELKVPAGNASYLSAKAVIVNEIGYAAQAGDIVSSVTVSRGNSASAAPSTVLALYSSATNDIATAAFLTSWPAVHTGLANTIQKFDIRPVYALEAGIYYWAVLTRAPGTYLHAAQNPTHQQLSFPLESPYTPPATLGEVERSAMTVEGVLFVEITNVIDRTVKTLSGTQVPQGQHIARFADSSYRADGARVDHNLYTTTGNLVEVRDNGSFTLSGDGNQSLLAKFSTDGVTWSADQTITIVDPTSTASEPPASLSGGDASLGWSATSLSAGGEITVETDGTYAFGQGPTATFKVGFGKGYLYDNPELKVLTIGDDLDDFEVIEDGARRIETIDGVRVMASRIRDANAWSGYQTAGRMITCDLGGRLVENEKFAAFRMLRTDYDGIPLNWQWKTSRLLSGSMDLDLDVEGEYMAHGSRANTNSLVKYTQSGNKSLPMAHPHANQGWVLHAFMIDFGNKGVANGRVLSYTARHGDAHQFNVVDVTDVVVEPDTSEMPEHFGCQDYWDNSNYGPEAIAAGAYEPDNLDQYTTDIFVQRGSFAHVALGDAPTREACRSYVVLPTVLWTDQEIKVEYWPSMGTFDAKYLYIYDDNGALVFTLHLEGTYTPPPWSAEGDVRGLRRNAGSIGTARRIVLTGVVVASNTQRWDFWVQPTDTATSLGICGSSASNVPAFVFQPDGSISLRMSGMSSLTTVRPAGIHLLSTTERQKVSLACTGGTQIDVMVNDIVVATHNGTGLSLGITKLMEATVGSNIVMYSAAYYEDGVLKNLFKMDEGSGNSIADEIGGATGVVGSDLVWVTE